MAGDLSSYADPVSSGGAEGATVVAGADVRQELILALRGSTPDLKLVFPAGELGPALLLAGARRPAGDTVLR
jgi:hypothetical protein